jgi:hypothetical protein
VDENVAVDAFEKFGPIPRICIDFAQTPSQLGMYERSCQAAVSKITASTLRSFVVSGGDLDLDGGSHKIFMVRRKKVDDLEVGFIQPISPYVEKLLKTAINTMQRYDRVELYNTFASFSATRVVAGLVYESLGHMRITEGITLTLKPMKKRIVTSLFHWNLCEPDPMDDSEVVTFSANPAII